MGKCSPEYNLNGIYDTFGAYFLVIGLSKVNNLADHILADEDVHGLEI